MTMHMHPRRVPHATILRLFCSDGATQASWFILGLGMIGLWIVLSSVDLSFITFLGEREHIKGTITASHRTKVSLNRKRVIAHLYRFVTPDGEVFEDSSYATGRRYPNRARVTIEYPAGKPHLSRIKGMRRQLLGPFFLILLLGPAIGLLMLGLRLRQGYRTLYLLRHGQLATGVLTHKEATGVVVYDQPTYVLTFTFTADDGKAYQMRYKHHDTATLEDEQEERLIYDPARPATAALLDTLPGTPDFDASGRLRPQPLPLMSLILPLCTIGGHTAYALSVVL